MLEQALFDTAQPAGDFLLPDVINNLLALSQQVNANKQQAYDRENDSDKQISTVSEGLVQAKALMVRSSSAPRCSMEIFVHCRSSIKHSVHVLCPSVTLECHLWPGGRLYVNFILAA